MSPARGPADPGLSPGQRLGPYRLLAPIGQGLMGVVFRAVRETDGETVALKVLRDELAGDELYRRRFHREGRIAGEVVHRHIVPVVDFGEACGRLYIAAHFVHGASLAERIAAQGTLPVAEAVRLASELAAGLDEIHARGLVHRDVKPANVMIDDRGAAALTDFGLARGTADTVLTKTGAVVGTVDYLAPEMIRGQPAGRSSDIYAFGCLLYESLAGAPPFAGKTYVDALLAHIREEPPALSALRGDVPASVSWSVLTALAKDPGERPPTATAFARLVRTSAKAG